MWWHGACKNRSKVQSRAATVWTAPLVVLVGPCSTINQPLTMVTVIVNIQNQLRASDLCPRGLGGVSVAVWRVRLHATKHKHANFWMEDKNYAVSLWSTTESSQQKHHNEMPELLQKLADKNRWVIPWVCFAVPLYSTCLFIVRSQWAFKARCLIVIQSVAGAFQSWVWTWPKSYESHDWSIIFVFQHLFVFMQFTHLTNKWTECHRLAWPALVCGTKVEVIQCCKLITSFRPKQSNSDTWKQP